MMTCRNDARISFVRSEDGAVAVDWVVLTAALVGLGLAAIAVTSGGVENLSGDTAVELAAVETGQTFGAGVNAGLMPFDIDPRNPGAFPSNADWVAQLSDDSIAGILQNYAQFSDVPQGAGHPVDQYYDQYWLAYNEALDRGIEIPQS